MVGWRNWLDADIILSENQWRGESPHKILVTHYRFESCPDYYEKHHIPPDYAVYASIFPDAEQE